MNDQLATYIDRLQPDIQQISEERKETLRMISDFISSILKKGNPAKLTFICTHNSRRSHFCQIWAATFARHLWVGHIDTFSGGTEATAFNTQAVNALQRAGFKIENPGGENPHYRVYDDENTEPIICFSKTFDDPANPSKDFAAIMTCSDADQNCPVVPGAAARFSIPYADPKEADGTPQERQTYNERCRQIAAEMYYMLSQI